MALYLEIQQAPATPLHHDDAAQGELGDDVQAHEAPAEELTFETLVETPYGAAKNEGARAETKTSERPNERDLLTNIGWFEWPWCGVDDRRGRRKAGNTGKGKARPPALGWAMRLPDGKVVEADGNMYVGVIGNDAGVYRDGKVHRKTPNANAEGPMPPPRFDGYRRYLGGLTYSALHNVRKGAEGGLLVSYIGSNGKDWSPKEVRSDKGSARHRSKAAIEAYLTRPAAIASPLHSASYQRPMHKPGWFDAGGVLAAKQEARDELEALMADYTGPITKCQPAVARSAWCMGGIVGNKETKSTPAPIWEAPAKRGLSPLLEAVAAGANLKELGHIAGHKAGAQRASKTGKAALLAEAGQLMEAAAKRGEPLPEEPNDTAKEALAELHARDARAAAWQAAKKARLVAANDNEQKKLAA